MKLAATFYLLHFIYAEYTRQRPSYELEDTALQCHAALPKLTLKEADPHRACRHQVTTLPTISLMIYFML